MIRTALATMAVSAALLPAGRGEGQRGMSGADELKSELLWSRPACSATSTPRASGRGPHRTNWALVRAALDQAQGEARKARGEADDLRQADREPPDGLQYPPRWPGLRPLPRRMVWRCQGRRWWAERHASQGWRCAICHPSDHLPSEAETVPIDAKQPAIVTSISRKRARRLRHSGGHGTGSSSISVSLP